VLLLSAANFSRAAQAWLRDDLLAQLGLAAPPEYLGLSGLAWGVVLGAAAAGLWRLRWWGRWLALGAVPLYHLQAWITRLRFDASDYARQVWPWEAAMALAGVVLTTGILLWPRVARAFADDS
jgi:hypothetical protein